MLLRCQELVGKVQGLRQEFPGLDPKVMMKLITIYLLSLYGCELWDIYSAEAGKLWATWHKMIKWEFKLPLPTHRFLLYPVSNCEHIRKRITKRFLKFHMKIKSSDNPNIILLNSLQCLDMRSTYGRNIQKICRDAGVQSIDLVDINSIHINPVPADEEWRIPLLLDLLESRDTNPGFLTREEAQLMIEHICIK